MVVRRPLVNYCWCGLVSVVLIGKTLGLEKVIRQLIEGIYTPSIGLDMFEWNLVDRELEVNLKSEKNGKLDSLKTRET